MIYRFPIKTVRDMLLNQVSNNFFKSIDDEPLISKHLLVILDRFEKNISHNDNKYYRIETEIGTIEPYFDPLHNSQWTLFLYLAANTIFRYENEKKKEAKVLCDKIYGQLKIISGCDLYYEVEMPEIFSLEHPTGSYIGRGKFGNYFSFTHDCSVGNIDGCYPIIGEHVTMKAGSRILGDSKIGDNSTILEGSLVKNQVIPANCTVSGITPNLVIIGKCTMC